MQSEIQLNGAVLKRFAVLKKKNRLAHAYLFIGPPDIGKSETAAAVAKLVNCETPRAGLFCDACPACLKINTGNHPDVLVVDHAFGESVKIEQVRDILERNKLRPFLAAQKVFIIKNVEDLTPDAANAFLKTLEEPAGDSLILLTTSVPERNLDTIRSRCHAIHFQPESGVQLAERLKTDYHIGAAHSHFFAYFAQGCLGTARRLHDNKFFERKNAVINAFILRRPDDARIKELLKDKEQTKELLDVCSSWIRDALLAKAGVEDGRLIHLDRVDDLRLFKKKYTFEELKELDRCVIKMHQLLADNLNIKLPLLIIGEQLWQK